MKAKNTIALLTADLSQGGVADHVKLLAGALSQRGVSALTLEKTPMFAKATQASCEQANATWIGLHFVCYGWARNGILGNKAIQEIAAACSGRRIALYLHELWIGESTSESSKNRLIGALQRRGILQLIDVLQPSRLLTSNPVYQAILSHQGHGSTLLPLPGNLPLPSADDHRAATDWLEQHALSKTTLAAVFGTIHPEWNPTSALVDWQLQLKKNGQQGALITMGLHGAAGAAILDRIKTRCPDLRVISTGKQAAPFVAGLIARCSFGIATSPWALVGKSGTAAAFLEAGLPTLVTRDDWQWRRARTPPPLSHPLLHPWPANDTFDWSLFLSTRRAPQMTLDRTADYWAELIQPSSNTGRSCVS